MHYQLSTTTEQKIYSSKFIHNEAHTGGVAVIASGISLELHSCNFDKNKVGKSGGAIKVRSLVTFATFKTNGALLIQETCIVILWNCSFYSNTSDMSGGTVYVIKESFRVNFYCKLCI